MRMRGVLALAIGVGAILACASPDVTTVPLCAPVAELPPLPTAGSCDERELAEYTSALSERIVGRGDRTLVRVEFDDAVRVRSACVEPGTARDAWSAKRDLADQLGAIGSLPSGPACLAQKRLDLNRYQAKLAEIDQAWTLCERQSPTARALRHCLEFRADWIELDAPGSTLPALFVKPEVANPPDLSASDTASRCARTNHRFEAETACIQGDGWELLEPLD